LVFSIFFIRRFVVLGGERKMSTGKQLVDHDTDGPEISVYVSAHFILGLGWVHVFYRANKLRGHFFRLEDVMLLCQTKVYEHEAFVLLLGLVHRFGQLLFYTHDILWLNISVVGMSFSGSECLERIDNVTSNLLHEMYWNLLFFARLIFKDLCLYIAIA